MAGRRFLGHGSISGDVPGLRHTGVRASEEENGMILTDLLIAPQVERHLDGWPQGSGHGSGRAGCTCAMISEIPYPMHV